LWLTKIRNTQIQVSADCRPADNKVLLPPHD